MAPASHRARRGLLAAAGAGCLLAMLLLGVAVGDAGTRPDRVLRRTLRTELSGHHLRRISHVLATETGRYHGAYLTAAAPLAVAGLAVLLQLLRGRRLDAGRWRWLLWLLTALVVEQVVRTFLGRAGPRELGAGEFRGAYPSGAAVLVALGWVTAFVVIGDLWPRMRPLLGAASVVALVVHAAVRVAVGKHWASDIAGSYLLVAGVVLLAAATRSAPRRSHGAAPADSRPQAVEEDRLRPSS